MDTINTNTHQSSVIPAVTLDSSQYFLYQTHQLEILSPDGQHLDFVGKAIKTAKAESQVFRLRDRVALVSCLLGNVNDAVTLPIPAVLGLTDLLERISETCYLQFK